MAGAPADARSRSVSGLRAGASGSAGVHVELGRLTGGGHYWKISFDASRDQDQALDDAIALDHLLSKHFEDAG